LIQEVVNQNWSVNSTKTENAHQEITQIIADAFKRIDSETQEKSERSIQQLATGEEV
jgi:hypothetical protein